MASDKQTQANRENAQRSTGPTSAAGKEAVSQNRTTHGLTGTFMFLSQEDQDEYWKMLGNMARDHQAGSDSEIELIRKMAQSIWRSRRAVELQDQCIEDIQLEDDPKASEARRNLDLYIRYQASHDRAYQRYAAELRKLQNEIKKSEIGFESQKRREAQEAHAQAQETRRESNENRRQQRHEIALTLDNARVEHQNLLNRKLAGEISERERANRVPSGELLAA